jgi:hypothetical protein
MSQTNVLKKWIRRNPKKGVVRMKDHTLEVPKYEGDIGNDQLVTTVNPHSDHEAVMVARPSSQPMTKAQALVHAAWIVAQADQSENFEEFRRVLKAVLET